MNLKKRSQGNAGRIEAGKVVLAAAQSVDTTLVAARLAAFTQAHAQFLEAVERINVAQAGIDNAEALVRERSALHDTALGKLIAQLVVDGHPRINPLTSYSAETPSGIAEMPPAARSTVVRELLGNVLRDERLSAGSRDAANACADATAALDEALSSLTQAETTAADLRHSRDAVADRWDDAFAALKRGARAAADEGAAGLYGALFDRLAKPATSKGRGVRTKQAEAA